MHLYKKMLEVSNIPETRSLPLAESLKSLHSAICALDQENRLRFGFINPEAVEAAISYALTEDLNAELWGSDEKVSVMMDNQSISDSFYIEFTPDCFDEEGKSEKEGAVINMEDYRKE